MSKFTEGLDAVLGRIRAAAEAAQLVKGGCKHPDIMPAFDAEAASNMTADEVREHFPRFYGTCPKCGWCGVLYASFEHYIAGDW